MKYVFFSDVHGDARSLTKIVKILSTIQHNMVVCLGDTIGYGPDPAECLEIVRENADVVLAGNHEYAVSGKRSWSFSNSRARKGFRETQEMLSHSELKFISKLPVFYGVHDMIFTHATPLDPESFKYPTLTPGGRPAIDPFQSAHDVFSQTSQRLAFVGHSHRPGVILETKKGTYTKVIPKNQKLELFGRRALIDVGGASLPRGNAPATIVEYDSDLDELTYHIVIK